MWNVPHSLVHLKSWYLVSGTFGSGVSLSILGCKQRNGAYELVYLLLLQVMWASCPHTIQDQASSSHLPCHQYIHFSLSNCCQVCFVLVARNVISIASSIININDKQPADCFCNCIWWVCVLLVLCVFTFTYLYLVCSPRDWSQALGHSVTVLCYWG